MEIENHYTSNAAEMKLTNMPSESEMTGEVKWRLYKLNRKVVIECEGNKVWEMEYIQLFDTKRVTETTLLQRSMRAWSKTVVDIKFDENDTGTQGYRKAGEKCHSSKDSMTGTYWHNIFYSLVKGTKHELSIVALISAKCLKGYYMTRETGCVECPKNTYSKEGAMSCTPCPDYKLSPRGTGDESSCTPASSGRFQESFEHSELRKKVLVALNKYLQKNKTYISFVLSTKMQIFNEV